MGRPVLVPNPGGAPDVPGDDVVFQHVTFLCRDACHAGFQAAEHILVAKAAGDGVQGRGQHGNGGLFQYIAADADVGGNLTAAKNLPDQRAVVLHTAACHADIPVAHALHGQAADGRRHPLHLAVRRVCPVDGDGVRLLRPRRLLPEQMLFQMAQRPRHPGGKILDFTGRPRLSGQAHQPFPLPHRIAEQGCVVLVPQQRHGDAVAAKQGVAQHPLLLGVEKGKTVHVQVGPVQIVAAGQGVRQLLHPGAVVKALGVEPGVVGGVQQRHIPQLVPRRPLQIRHPGHQRVRGDGVGAELVKELHELLQKGGAPRGSGEHRQRGGKLLQTPAQGENLAAVIQREVGKAPGLRQHPGGKGAEGQHLRVPPGGVPQGAAQVHFRLMGGMLRHQQQLAAVAAVLGDGVHAAAGLPRPGPADP